MSRAGGDALTAGSDQLSSLFVRVSWALWHSGVCCWDVFSASHFTGRLFSILVSFV